MSILPRTVNILEEHITYYIHSDRFPNKSNFSSCFTWNLDISGTTISFR